MKRRTFIAMLGCTALVPVLPAMPPGLFEAARTTTKLWGKVVLLPSLVMDFTQRYLDKDGVACRLEDVITLRKNI